MSEQSVGVKETLEAIDGLGAVVDAVAKAMEDGKLSLSDALIVPGLIMALQPAVSGVAGVKAELADLSAEEAKVVVGALIDKVIVKIAEKFPKV